MLKCITNTEKRVIKYLVFIIFRQNVFRQERKSSRNNQLYAQICTTALFHILAATCFDSSLSSSGSFWIRLSYIKIQIDLVVYHIMWLSGLHALSWEAQQTEPRHSGTQTT
jgi:hypothetical protein